MTKSTKTEKVAKICDSKKEVLVANHRGEIIIGDIHISCCVAIDENNGKATRLITQTGMMQAIGRQGKSQGEDRDSNLPSFLASTNLKPFITKDLTATLRPVIYKLAEGGVCHGYDARLLPKVCLVYLNANRAGVITPRQVHIVQACQILIEALADTGIVSLVDEATGYQKERGANILQEIFSKYLRDNLSKWTKQFPDELYKQIYRLRGWPTFSVCKKKFMALAKITIDLVYERLAVGILEEMKRIMPRYDSGRKKGCYHQLLTAQIGIPALGQHIHTLIVLAQASSDWNQFYAMVQRILPKKSKILQMEFDF